MNVQNHNISVEMPKKDELWTESRLGKLTAICQPQNVTDGRIVEEDGYYLVEVVFLDTVIGVGYQSTNRKDAEEYLKKIHEAIEINKKSSIITKNEAAK